MSKNKKKGAIARLEAIWGDVLFSADMIENYRDDMTDILYMRAAAGSEEEQLYLATQGPAVWVGERIRKALVAGDGCWGDTQLMSVHDVEQEIFARGEWIGNWPSWCYFEGLIEDALLDALIAALQLQAERVSLDAGTSLVWRFCYRLAQVSALVADAGRKEAHQNGRRGGPKEKTGSAEACRFALQYLNEHCFDGGEEITQQQVLVVSIWDELFKKSQSNPGTFSPAFETNTAADGNVTYSPTDGARNTIERWIRKDWQRLKSLGRAGFEARRAARGQASQEFLDRRREKYATPDTSTE